MPDRHRVVLVECEPFETRIAVLENGKVVDLEVDREDRRTDNIYKGVVRRLLPERDAALVDIGWGQDGWLFLPDILPGGLGVRGQPKGKKFQDVREALKEGDCLLVQVTEVNRFTEGPRLTTRIGLRGHYCVLLCQGPERVGVSVKVTDERIRERLRRLGMQLRPSRCGLIFRHHAVKVMPEAISLEVEGLFRRWQEIVRAYGRAEPTALLFSRPAIFADTLWEIVTPETERIFVDGEEEAEELRRLALEIRPDVADRIEVYRGKTPIFEYFNVEPQLRPILDPTIPLPSGGSLSFDETSSFTFIRFQMDNPPRFPRRVAQRINQEAIEEIGRQIRLRDLSGTIFVDLTSLLPPFNPQKWRSVLGKALGYDRNPLKVTDLMAAGVVGILRQRRGESLWSLLTHPCPHCQGRGRVKSPLTLSLGLRRKIRAFAASLSPQESGALVVEAHPEIAGWLALHEDAMASLERKIGRPIVLLVNPHRDPSDALITVCPEGESEFPSLLGAEFPLNGLVPSEDPLFTVHANRLIRIPEDARRERCFIRVIAEGRWFCEGKIIITEP